MLDAVALRRHEQLVCGRRSCAGRLGTTTSETAWRGLQMFEQHPETFTRPLDIVQIGVVCTLGYADFHFPNCGWCDHFPRLKAFHEQMSTRPSVRGTVLFAP